MLSLNFSSEIPGSVADNDGQGTGFTSIQPNNNNQQYDPTRINLDPTTGTLVITATQGTSFNTANTLKNALQVGVNATNTFIVSTRLKSPTNLTSPSQQGGIFIGSNQNNYVKLTLIRTGTGTKIQFAKEENGVGSVLSEIAINSANTNTLDLFLTGDPFTGKISAAYRVNSGTGARITFAQSFQPSAANAAAFFGDETTRRAGILASTTNGPDVNINFDSFGIAQTIKVNFQPDSAALPTGYIKDTGAAYDPIRGYGWINQAARTPLNITANARDRNRAGVDQRLDTIMHMQLAGTPAAAWEYDVPNGIYSVTVSVGDQPSYNSKHTIRVEGIIAINRFQATTKQEYRLATVTATVTDGKLTIDPGIGTNLGTNTKINFLEVTPITPGSHPRVSGSAIASDSTGVFRDAAVNVDVALVTAGAGVDLATLNTTNVRLYRTRDNALVSGIVGTSGGNDAIVYQPNDPLEANTNYTFRISDGVRDETGNSFTPFSRTFNTGANFSIATDPQVNFTKSVEYTGDAISSVLVGPDGKLYAATLDGKVHRWNIDSLGNLSNQQTFAPTALSGRAIIGLTFNPNDASELWISHNDALFPQPADDFSGKISKLTLNNTTPAFDATLQDYVVNLPRAAKDHLSNSLAFGSGPNPMLYITQGSNSAMGAPDNAWANRRERLLSGAVLEIDPRRTAPVGGFNVQTESYTDRNDNTTTGNYDPFALNAPVKIYATGVRNAYDLVWHSNGNLYIPTNGSAAGGNTPDNPNTAANEALIGVGTQHDYLFRVEAGGYYGHPNPLRGEYIMNGGNPTSGVDPAEVVAQTGYAGYAVGTARDSNYRGFAYDFGRNRSPNGAIEYKSNTFGGALQNRLLVVEYSGGDDILALNPDSTFNNGDIPRGNVTRVFSQLTDPLDLAEDSRNNRGNLYVAELIDGGVSGQISLLRPS